MSSSRQRFLNGVRTSQEVRPVVSPFLPHPPVINNTLAYLNLPVTDDFVQNEIRLSQALDYEPMFMTDCAGLLFPWRFDESRSNAVTDVYTIPTSKGDWVRSVPRDTTLPTNEHTALNATEETYPVQTEADHDMLVLVCEEISERKDSIRDYFHTWRQRVEDNGVIVMGHPHASWLAHQVSQAGAFYHWADYPDKFKRSMDAIYNASLFIMEIAIDEGIDFMSDSSYGLEMTSPDLFELLDLPYIKNFSDWTHERDGLIWYHNCGKTRVLIAEGFFNRLGVDVIETIAPPPAGDNDLVEARSYLESHICTKGNLDLGLLRNGTPDQVATATRQIIQATRGTKHIYSTADAVLEGTPPENFIAFIRTVREYAEV